MNHDDLDDLRDRNRAADEARRYRASDQQKQRQADDLKRRFARYSGGAPKVAWLKGPARSWGRWALAALVVAYVAWVILA
ncbi:hypothetical protein [Rhodoferax sp. PAMC 29310]|uniref:hypothetical protein n=1 Tax=Rhodoferax sp. PAMC 29310 TaxID=2822760 RepID=UPI001B332946|nr:hypothetical protein [Rhodoferax sp. PAMC 29310]